MFIKLTLNSNNRIYLNAFSIDHMLGNGDYTVLYTKLDNFIVKETPEEILKLIKECEK